MDSFTFDTVDFAFILEKHRSLAMHFAITVIADSDNADASGYVSREGREAVVLVLGIQVSLVISIGYGLFFEYSFQRLLLFPWIHAFSVFGA